MLTESEKKWLEKRSIGYCQMWCTPNSLKCHIDRCCPTQLSFMDYLFEAMFEARVAAKLADEHEKIMLNAGVCEACFAWGTCFNGFEENDNAFCAFEMLKAARLAVEEEMNSEMDKRKA